jgi:hypothetical protein
MRLHNIGVSVSDTKPDTRIAMVTVTANSRNMRPTTPPMNRTGMNTATSESVIDRMVKPISRLPRSAARNGVSPASTWRTMFSSMTMASSTMNPTESVSAISDILFKLKPHSCMAAKVPNMDNGSASAGMRVAEALRTNRNMTSTTRTAVNPSVRCTSATEALIDCDRSSSTSILTDGGIAARRIGSSARILSTTSTVLEPGWR